MNEEPKVNYNASEAGTITTITHTDNRISATAEITHGYHLALVSDNITNDALSQAIQATIGSTQITPAEAASKNKTNISDEIDKKIIEHYPIKTAVEVAKMVYISERAVIKRIQAIRKQPGGWELLPEKKKGGKRR